MQVKISNQNVDQYLLTSYDVIFYKYFFFQIVLSFSEFLQGIKETK